MYIQHEIKKQWFKCWSNQFITNVNKGDGERGGRTLLRIGNDGDSAAIHQDRSWGFTEPEKPLRGKKVLEGQLPIEAHNGPLQVTRV